MPNSSHSSYKPLRFLTQVEKQWAKAIIRNALSAVYFTFTFAERIDSQQANRTFRSFIEILSGPLRLRENIGYLLAEERALSGLSNCRELLHLHGVLMSNAPLIAKELEERWSWAVGHAKVDPYDFSKEGLGYMLKKINHDGCDWKLSDNIHFFVPGYQPRDKSEGEAIERHCQRKKARIAASC